MGGGGGQQTMGGGGGQQTIGGGGSQQTMGGTPVVQFDEFLPSEIRTPLHDFSRLKKSAEWAAEQSHHTVPQDVYLSRILEDIADVAELNEKLLVRESHFVIHEGQAFLNMAQETLTTLQNYSQEPFIPAIISDLQRTINSTYELLEWYEQGGQGTMQGSPQTMQGGQTEQQFGQPMGQQFGQSMDQQFGQPQSAGQGGQTYGQF